MFAQLGSSKVSQWRYAFNLHSSSHSGSFFFAEMNRTISSLNPFGAESDSKSEMNPYLYSVFATFSNNSCSVLIFLDENCQELRTLQDSFINYTEKLSPQPQVRVALGL